MIIKKLRNSIDTQSNNWLDSTQSLWTLSQNIIRAIWDIRGTGIFCRIFHVPCWACWQKQGVTPAMFTPLSYCTLVFSHTHGTQNYSFDNHSTAKEYDKASLVLHCGQGTPSFSKTNQARLLREGQCCVAVMFCYISLSLPLFSVTVANHSTLKCRQRLSQHKN